MEIDPDEYLRLTKVERDNRELSAVATSEMESCDDLAAEIERLHAEMRQVARCWSPRARRVAKAALARYGETPPRDPDATGRVERGPA